MAGVTYRAKKRITTTFQCRGHHFITDNGFDLAIGRHAVTHVHKRVVGKTLFANPVSNEDTIGLAHGTVVSDANLFRFGFP